MNYHLVGGPSAIDAAQVMERPVRAVGEAMPAGPSPDAALALHQLALDTMAHGVCMFDAEQRAVLFNQQYLAMFDFSPEVVRPGMTFRAMLEHLAQRGFLPEPSVERLWQERSARLALGEPFSIRRQRPNGRTIAVHFRPTAAGSWVCVCEDVSAQARMEFELRQQVELLDQAIGNISQGLCMYGADGCLIICNDQYLQMYGLSPEIIKPGCTLLEDIKHRQATGSFLGDPQRYCDEIISQCATSTRVERFVATAHGRVIRVVHRSMPDGGWVTTHEDVTEARLADEAMRKTNHLLENTFEHMDEGITLFDADLRLLAVNRRCRELLNFPADMARPGTPLADLVRFNARRGEYGTGDIEEHVRERVAAARLSEPQTFHRTRPDGTVLEVRGCRLPDGGLITIYADITKRIQAENDARAAHERLRDALEVVPEGLALFDADDRYVLWNRRYAEIYAESASEICVGARFEDALRAGLARGQYPEAVGHEEAWVAERMALHRESESAHEQALPGDRWLRVQERRTADGGSIGIRVDITELKRREDSFKLLFESNPVPMFVFDVETLRYVAVNDAALDFYGYTRDQFLGLTAAELRPADARDGFAAMVRGFDNKRQAAPSRHQAADCSIKEVEVYSRALTYGGRAARFAAVIDTTERRRAEAERDRSQAFLHQIIDTVPISITVKDAKERRWQLINHAAEKFLGLPREQVIGRTAEEILPKETADMIDQRDGELIASSPGEILVGQYETATPHNGMRTISTRRMAIRDEDGTASFLVGTVEDITERKAIENQLHHAQKMEAVGNLTGGLAHDFNNLLTIIIGNLDLLQGELAGHPSAEEKVQIVIEASERGSELTRQLLAFSRRQSLQPKLVDINALVSKTTQLVARTLGGNLTIDVRPAADLWPVRIDEAQLESALINIAINARDAMPDGGRLLIETRNSCLDADYVAHQSDVAPGDYAAIEISDTGVGMPPEVLARIFDPFFTTKGPGKGTGLGLSMVFGFVKQSGGHITAYSEIGKGTTFKLYLPRQHGAERTSNPQAEEGARATTPSSAVILVVDDDAGVRATVVSQLSNLGYQVLEAESPVAALEMLDKTARIDLMFTDMVMPGGINGKRLAALARDKRPGLRVLFTSGFPGAFLNNDIELSAGDALLSKPYRRADLERAVRQALDGEGAASA
jgi:PAS domain S-box-containing protein